jgi:hypothetical protein
VADEHDFWRHLINVVTQEHVLDGSPRQLLGQGVQGGELSGREVSEDEVDAGAFASAAGSFGTSSS